MTHERLTHHGLTVCVLGRELCQAQMPCFAALFYSNSISTMEELTSEDERTIITATQMLESINQILAPLVLSAVMLSRMPS
jgi:hypothetical protein